MESAGNQFKAEAVVHIGVVVKDVKKIAEIWESEWGIGNWTFGEGGGYRVGITFLGPIMFELYQPVEGEPVSEGMAQAVPLYKDFLEKWGDGIHHLAFAVDDVPKEAANLEARGGKAIAKSPTGGWAYLESTGPGGVIFELMQKVDYEDHLKFAHVLRRGIPCEDTNRGEREAIVRLKGGDSACHMAMTSAPTKGRH